MRNDSLGVMRENWKIEEAKRRVPKSAILTQIGALPSSIPRHGEQFLNSRRDEKAMRNLDNLEYKSLEKEDILH